MDRLDGFRPFGLNEQDLRQGQKAVFWATVSYRGSTFSADSRPCSSVYEFWRTLVTKYRWIALGFWLGYPIL